MPELQGRIAEYVSVKIFSNYLGKIRVISFQFNLVDYGNKWIKSLSFAFYLSMGNKVKKEAILSELSRCFPRAKEFEVPHLGHLTVLEKRRHL